MEGAGEGIITEDKMVPVEGTWGYVKMDECVTEDSTSGSADVAAEAKAPVEEDDEIYDTSRMV